MFRLLWKIRAVYLYILAACYECASKTHSTNSVWCWNGNSEGECLGAWGIGFFIRGVEGVLKTELNPGIFKSNFDRSKTFSSLRRIVLRFITWSKLYISVEVNCEGISGWLVTEKMWFLQSQEVEFTAPATISKYRRKCIQNLLTIIFICDL